MFFKMDVLKNVANFTGKHQLEFLFNKVAGLKACDFIKERLQRRCFLVKFANFLRKPFTKIIGLKVEIISAFQRNRYFRKVIVNKTFADLQEQKKAMLLRHSAYISASVKSPLAFTLLPIQ